MWSSGPGAASASARRSQACSAAWRAVSAAASSDAVSSPSTGASWRRRPQAAPLSSRSSGVAHTGQTPCTPQPPVVRPYPGSPWRSGRCRGHAPVAAVITQPPGRGRMLISRQVYIGATSMNRGQNSPETPSAAHDRNSPLRPSSAAHVRTLPPAAPLVQPRVARTAPLDAGANDRTPCHQPAHRPIAYRPVPLGKATTVRVPTANPETRMRHAALAASSAGRRGSAPFQRVGRSRTGHITGGSRTRSAPPGPPPPACAPRSGCPSPHRAPTPPRRRPTRRPG